MPHSLVRHSGGGRNPVRQGYNVSPSKQCAISLARQNICGRLLIHFLYPFYWIPAFAGMTERVTKSFFIDQTGNSGLELYQCNGMPVYYDKYKIVIVRFARGKSDT